MGDTNEGGTPKDSRPGRKLKRLKRGYSDEADRLLDWLV